MISQRREGRLSPVASLDYGYAHAPLEMDAHAHEQVGESDIPAE